MSDLPPQPAPAPAPAGPAPGSAPAPAPPSGDAPEPSSQPVPSDPGELSALVTKLRDENIRYKERFRPWEQTVGALHPSDSAFILDFVQSLYSNDENRAATAVNNMRAALDQLSPAQQEQVKAAIAEASPNAEPEFDPYNPANIDERVRAQLEATLAERDEAQAYERAVDQAQSRMAEHARELGDQYGIAGFADARTKEGRMLYMTAHNDFPNEPDPMVKLDLAAQALDEFFRKQGQELLKAKTADAAPSPVPADATEPSGTKKPRDLAEANKAAAARLDKILSGGVGT